MDQGVLTYLNALPEDRRERFMSLHALILQNHPDATVDMRYKMPTYRIGDGWVALANQKQYISLYTCSESHIARYKRKHPEQKTGKGCIKFRTRDRIHYDDLASVIKHAFEFPKP